MVKINNQKTKGGKEMGIKNKQIIVTDVKEKTTEKGKKFVSIKSNEGENFTCWRNLKFEKNRKYYIEYIVVDDFKNITRAITLENENITKAVTPKNESIVKNDEKKEKVNDTIPLSVWQEKDLRIAKENCQNVAANILNISFEYAKAQGKVDFDYIIEASEFFVGWTIAMAKELLNKFIYDNVEENDNVNKKTEEKKGGTK